MTAYEGALLTLKSFIAQHKHHNVFNADGCCLFYSMAHDRSNFLHHNPVRKKAQEQIMILPCAYIGGSEKFDCMINRTTWEPRAFKKKSGAQLCFEYHANKEVWISKNLVFSSLQRFDAYNGKTTDRKALLLIDNCSAPGTASTCPNIANLLIEYLTLN